MTKEEVIKEAWGVHYSIDIDENGYRTYTEFQVIHLNQWVGDSWEKGFNEILKIHWVRPKSLQGIENNNGWIKIESEDDLPKDEENLDYWVMEDEQIVHAKFMPESKRWYCDIDLNLRLFPSHYQPMVKPKPPIY